MHLSPGDRLGPYEILAPLGAGGMGTVYRAKDPRLDRTVAIKVSETQFNARFAREARAIAALNHPNICQIHDVGPDYLVLEYVEGKPVSGPMALDEVLKLAIQIAAALEEAHGRGILHRDLKPGNILVTAAGAGKLIDFGLAKQTSISGSDVTGSIDGAIVGTVAYMSPEQAEGRALDDRSDIFSFGIVLYELLSGKRAFQGDSAATILSALLRDDPPPLDAPPVLRHIVQKCLEKRPADRYSSMAELRAALEEAASSGAEAPHAAFHATLAARNTVGRDDEQAQLWRAYTRVKAGRGLILAVTGEAGIGKTSTIEKFLADLDERGERPVIARGRCSQRLAGEEPYLPILEAFDSLLHPQAGHSFAALMKTVAPTWYALASGGAGQNASSQNGSSPNGSSPEPREAVSQERMKREFGALAQELSKRQPFIFFIEDLHWADISTVDIFNYLASRFDNMRVLVLNTFRPSDMALRGHPFIHVRNDLQARGMFQEVPLPFLTADDVKRYLELEFPGHAFPDNFAATIHTKTEGSPLFMTDLVRYLRDTGGIVEEGDRWSVARSLPRETRDLPESVRGMIQRKIEQVEEQDRKLLVAASVQGPEFDSSVVAEAVEMDAADVEERLDRLERVNVFVRRGEEREFPDGSLSLNYQFVHVLYQNALYDSLQPTRRAALSGRVARALVARHGKQVSSVAARVAVLFEAARDFSASARYYHLASARSAELFAFRESLALAERGLKALNSMPEGPERKRQELVLQMMKGIALRSTSGWATTEIEQVFSRARQLVQQLEDPPELIPVLWATTLFHLIRGNLIECRDNADELMQKAVRSGVQAYIMSAFHIGGVVREFIGDMVESSRMLERCRELHLPAEHLAYVSMHGQDSGTIGRAMSSRPLWALGYPDRAIERAVETLGVARSQGHPNMVVFALVVKQGIHLYRGEAEASLATGEEIMALCREYELLQEAVWSRGFEGYALYLAGRTDEGIAVLKRSLAEQKAISAGLVRSAFLALLADALCHAGRIEEGLAAIAEGFEHAEQTSEGGYVAELYRVRGQLLMQSNPALAEADLRQAIAYAQNQQTKSFELRAACALARRLHSEGKSAEARAVLKPVYNWFTEGHTTADLIAARTLLSEIG